MKKVTLVLLAAGLGLAACSKPASTENSSAAELNGTELNASDNLTDANSSVIEDSNGSNLS